MRGAGARGSGAVAGGAAEMGAACAIGEASRQNLRRMYVLTVRIGVLCTPLCQKSAHVRVVLTSGAYTRRGL